MNRTYKKPGKKNPPNSNQILFVLYNHFIWKMCFHCLNIIFHFAICVGKLCVCVCEYVLFYLFVAIAIVVIRSIQIAEIEKRHMSLKEQRHTPLVIALDTYIQSNSKWNRENSIWNSIPVMRWNDDFVFFVYSFFFHKDQSIWNIYVNMERTFAICFVCVFFSQ